MNITVIAFASAREALGAPERVFDLPDGSDLEALKARLAADHPALADQWPRLAVALDGVLVRGNQALTAGQEVALLPPVSGGSA